MSADQQKYSFAVLTMSDKGSRGEREDTSGAYIKEKLIGSGYTLLAYSVIPDQKRCIIDALIELTDELQVDLIVTTGGTGLSPTDITPEAMVEVVEREIPGIAEAMRAASMLITPRAMLSRGKAGTRGESLIINLPGSLKAAKENLDVVLPVLDHAIEKIKGGTSDCGVDIAT